MPGLTLAVLALVGACLPTTLAQNACSFVSDSFACSLTKAQSYAAQCSCFSCKETDGVGFYQCNGATLCASDYKSTSYKSLTPDWWISAYISIGVVFVVVSALVYAALRVLARFKRVLKGDADKDPDAPERPKRDRVYRYVYDWAFGGLYKADGLERKRFGEFCIAGVELLDCFWFGAQRKEFEHDWRPFYLRAMRLVSTLSVGASLGLMLGSLDFDATECHTHTTVSLCASNTTTPNTNATTITCDNGPAILDGDSLISQASIVAFVATQCVKYVASYAQVVGEPRSKLDTSAHAIWLLVALIAFPVSYSVSSSLLSPNAYAYKTSSLRVRIVVSVTLSTWIKDQALDFVRAPAVFVIKGLASKCFSNPHEEDKKQTVEPMPFELAPPVYGADQESILSDVDSKVDPSFLELDFTDSSTTTKIDSVTSPRPTTTEG